MRQTRVAWRVGGIVAAVCLFMWILAASDYSAGILSGAYSFRSAHVASTLTLQADGTFRQQLVTGSGTAIASGTWQSVGGGGLTFSSEFLPIPGQQRSTDGTSYANIDKLFGIFVSLKMTQFNLLWFSKSDSSGTTLTGTYTGYDGKNTLELRVDADHSFRERVTLGDLSKDSVGTWSLENGRITFLSGFLNGAGEPLGADERAFDRDPRDGHMQVEVAKTGDPVFRKRYWFRR